MKASDLLAKTSRPRPPGSGQVVRIPTGQVRVVEDCYTPTAILYCPESPGSLGSGIGAYAVPAGCAEWRQLNQLTFPDHAGLGA